MAWSIAGAVAGAGLTWLVRLISSLILGRESLGMGDVTLMAMIGSFVGWQAVLLIFALAPVSGLILAMTGPLLTGRSYLPYGPCLSLSCLIVQLSFRWLWPPLRLIFGHPPTILGVVGGATFLLMILLGAWKTFQALPAHHLRQRHPAPQPLEATSHSE